jgi:predicted ATP-dependent serine protease
VLNLLAQVGVMEMGECGFVDATNVAGLFLSSTDCPQPGSAVGITVEGTRALCVEIQVC